MTPARSNATARLIYRRFRWQTFDTIAAVGLTGAGSAAIVWVLIGDQSLDVDFMRTFVWILLYAVLLNLYATTASFGVGMLIGFLTGWARAGRVVHVGKVLREYRAERTNETDHRRRRGWLLALTILVIEAKYAIRRVADGFVEAIRGTPLYVQIVFAWSVLLVVYPGSPGLQAIGSLLASPFPGQTTLAFFGGIIALTLNTGGYQSEIFRAGLLAVHGGQVEAARAVGFSRWGAMRHVVFPQALRLVVPPLTNEYIGLFKASSLLSVLGGVAEITIVGAREAYRGQIFEVFALLTGIFLMITVSLSFVVRFLERRYRIPGLGIDEVRKGRIGA